jgi:hypothetical protein
MIDQKLINLSYAEGMIYSMEYDYDSWKMETCGGASYSWLEFTSPEYKSPAGVRKVYAITLNYNGVYIDGRIQWTIPASIYLNPFNSLFWRYWIAKRKLIKYLKAESTRKHLEYLRKHIA